MSAKKTPTRQAAIGELKVKVLSIIQRLEDRDTTAKAAEELRSMCEGLPPSKIAAFIGTLTEAVEHPLKKAFARKEVIRTLADAVGYHAENVEGPLLTRVIAGLTKGCADKDTAVREECAEAFGSVVISLPEITPLCNAMETSTPDHQHGAALALQAVISAPAVAASGDERQIESAKAKAEAIARSVEKGLIQRLLRILSLPTFTASSSLLMVFGRLASIVPAALAPMLPTLFNSLPGWLGSKDHNVRRGAATALAVVARLAREEPSVQAVLTDKRKDQLLLVLEGCRFDKIKAVRDAVTDAIDALSGELRREDYEEVGKSELREAEQHLPTKEADSEEMKDRGAREATTKIYSEKGATTPSADTRKPKPQRRLIEGSDVLPPSFVEELFERLHAFEEDIIHRLSALESRVAALEKTSGSSATAQAEAGKPLNLPEQAHIRDSLDTSR